MTRPIIVAGAGPGGLTFGAALHRAGLPVVVLERWPTLRTAGAGITLQINAMRMLQALGLAEPIAAAGEPLTGGTIAMANGTALANLSLTTAVERFGVASVAIHRGTLAEILASAVPAEQLRFGAEVVDVEQDDTQVWVTLGDGRRIEGRALVAADGIHSVVRTRVFGPQPIRYAGYTCWRGVAEVPRPLGDATSTERWGRGQRFGIVPIDAHRSYWFATANAPAEGTDGPDPQAELLERFAAFTSPVPQVLRATPSEAILRNDIIDLKTPPQWSRGRVTLLGDAAHAMTPNLGQGACQAIEDAIVLAHHLTRKPVKQAFEAYERDRRTRAQSFVERSWRLGRLAQWENAAARAVRDTLLRLTPSSIAAANLERAWAVEVPDL